MVYMHKKLNLLWSLLLGSVAVAGFVLCDGVYSAQAQFGNVFSALEGTVSQIGGFGTGIQIAQADMMNLQQVVRYPQQQISQVQGFMSSMNSTYQPWMNTVINMPINSATLLDSQQLETECLSSNVNSLVSIGQSYKNLYSNPLGLGKTNTSSLNMLPQAQNQVDMSDTVAQDSMQRSVASDQSAQNIVTTAQNISSQLSAVAPGNTALAQIQNAAAQLQSMAYQHKVLAAELRLRATSLAAKNSNVKIAALTGNNSTNVNNNLLLMQQGGVK